MSEDNNKITCFIIHHFISTFNRSLWQKEWITLNIQYLNTNIKSTVHRIMGCSKVESTSGKGVRVKIVSRDRNSKWPENRNWNRFGLKGRLEFGKVWRRHKSGFIDNVTRLKIPLTVKICISWRWRPMKKIINLPLFNLVLKDLKW